MNSLSFSKAKMYARAEIVSVKMKFSVRPSWLMASLYHRMNRSLSATVSS